MWRDMLVMRRREAVATGLVLLPVVLSALSMLGFACGITVGRGHFPLALATAMGATLGLCPVRRVKNMLLTLVIVIVSIALSGIFVMYTNADAEYYHRPGAVFLANGWNPLRVTEAAEVGGLMGGGVKAWCVAYIPRMSWLFGAALSKWLGFVESSDALNIIMFFASLVFVHDWVLGIFRQYRLAIVLTVVMCLSPVVVSMMWGGSMDAAWYSAFLVAATCASRKLYLPMLLAMLVMSGVKFTGAVMSVLIFATYGLALLIWHRKSLFRLVAVGIVTGILMFLVNASPYITSTIRHGGPFYPSHSFVKSEQFEDDKNPITNDLTFMNDDARQVGWAGRIAWGYVSQDLCKWYYCRKLNKPDFNPDFQVSGGVGGYGWFFRLFFVLSLFLWPWVRNLNINLMAGLILFSVLIQPTVYSGYARYVPQFYLFPILVAIGVMARVTRPSLRWLGASVCVVFMIAIGVKSFFMLPLQWLTSVQNLQVISVVCESDGAVLVARTPYSRSALLRDCGTGLRVVEDENDPLIDGKCAIGSYFRFYRIWVDRQPEDWYSLAHVASMNDPTVKANRNANNLRFFIKEFLPSELMMIPRRLGQLVALRWRQFVRANGVSS